MTIAAAKSRLSIPELWLKLELPGEPGGSCRSPFREDIHPSFVIYEDGLGYYDHGESKGGDAIDFLQRATGLSKPAACRKFLEMANGQPVHLLAAIPRYYGRVHSEKLSGARVKEKRLHRITNLPPFLKDIDTANRRWFFEDLARLRHVNLGGIKLAHARGLLEFCSCTVPGSRDAYEYYPESDEPAWVITDRTRYNAQVRWLNGDRWVSLEGEPKAKTWPGSCAKWPIGIREALPYPLIVLVEGGPDLLAAHHFAVQAGVDNHVGVVAMMGAGMDIHGDALPLFAGKRVRIIPDVDDPGQRGAEKWSDQLREAGADVDAFQLNGLRKADDVPVKDLNDCCLIHADEAIQLEALFVV